METLDNTGISLSMLIESLSKNLCCYASLMDTDFEYKEIVTHLHGQTELFLKKLKDEYKRLFYEDFLPDRKDLKEFTYDADIPDACIKLQEEMIRLYSVMIKQDILWEVLPVLAKHLDALQQSQIILQDSLERDEYRYAIV